MEDTQKLKYRAKLIDGKLMLTSSDIQVGDKAYSSLSDDIFDPVLHESSAELLRSLLAYKIIGEISPDATWVKKGDDFDDTQIAFNSNEDGTERFLMGFDWAKPEEGYNRLIYIKGPCGHFH